MNLRSLRLIIGTAISVAALCAPSLALAGAWGVGSFENDDAADWSSACSQSLGIGPVVRALNDVFSPGYLEAPQAAEAIAAAEVVAAALGRPSDNFPENLRRWLQRQPHDTLARLAGKAREALLRVQDPETSELAQLMAESHAAQWRAELRELMRRLGGQQAIVLDSPDR